MNVSKLFSYNPLGYLVNTQLGRRAGTTKSNGYRQIGIKGKCYLEHRLVWYYHFGVFPSEIDHINGNKLDNRIENLREVSRKDNQLNIPKNVNNPLCGVSRHPCGKWRARFAQKHLGLFQSIEEARRAYEVAREVYFE